MPVPCAIDLVTTHFRVTMVHFQLLPIINIKLEIAKCGC